MIRLKQLRLERNLLQKDVAAAIFVERSLYNRYENGTTNPPLDVLVRLSSFFDVSTDYLLGKTDIKKAPDQRLEVSDEDIQFALFGGKVSDEAFEDVKRFAEFIKEKYTQKEKEKEKED